MRPAVAGLRSRLVCLVDHADGDNGVEPDVLAVAYEASPVDGHDRYPVDVKRPEVKVAVVVAKGNRDIPTEILLGIWNEHP